MATERGESAPVRVPTLIAAAGKDAVADVLVGADAIPGVGGGGVGWAGDKWSTPDSNRIRPLRTSTLACVYEGGL